MLKQVFAGLFAFALVASFGLAPDALAKKSKEDEAKELKEWKDKMIEKYRKEKKGAVSVDFNYWIDLESLEDGRWDSPAKLPFQDVKESGGIQMYATWKANAQAPGPAIRVFVTKTPHSETKGSSKTTFSNTFKYIGESVKWSDAKKIHEGFYNDWVKGATDVIKSDCVKPRKKKAGPAKFFASAVGTDPESKERERIDWYVWTTGDGSGYTWVARIRFDKSILGKEGILDKGEEFIKAIKELKDKRP